MIFEEWVLSDLQKAYPLAWVADEDAFEQVFNLGDTILHFFLFGFLHGFSVAEPIDLLH